MADILLSGLGVALVTPFKGDLTIDYEALERVIDHIINGGCDYIVALGTTAETPTLSKAEKNEIAEFIRNKAHGRVPLVIGIGGNNTAQVIEELTHRDLKGYDAVLSVTPYYNKPTQEGLYQHFKALSEASPLPILLYNVPGRTGVNLTSKTTQRLASLSNICGIKEASGNIEQSEEIIKECRDNFYVISGDDSLTCCLMQKGAIGLISVLANACPRVVKNLVRLCEERKFEEASNLQKRLNHIIEHLFEDGNPAGVKFVLSKMGLIENVLRLPLVKVSKEIEKKLEEDKKLIEEIK